MDSLLQLTSLELADLIRRRDVSPVEVVDRHVRRIEAVNPALNAVVATRFEQALDEARDAERRVMTTEPRELPPLLGVPCTIKDFYAVTGMPQTGGLVRRKGEIAREDAEVVRRVRAAGAIVTGVTNVPEGGLWLETDNRVYGRCNNPWDLRRTPGGSSGGEGAIVAAGGSPFGMGSDIGGSIRLPAAFCGVAGHKPTGRLVPTTGHWPPLDDVLLGYLACGPLARSVRDLMPLLEIVAGPIEGDDGVVERFELGRPERVDLSRVTVFPLEDSGVRPQPAVRDALRLATRTLERRGARVERLRSDLLKSAFWIWSAMMDQVEGMSYAELVSGKPALPIVSELFKLALGRSHHTAPVLAVIAGQSLMQLLPSRRNAELIRLGQSLQRELQDKLGDDGVLLHPPYARAAPFHNAPLLRPFDAGYTCVFNVLELPATQVPTGLDANGLPLGVQVVGARGRDHLCIAVAQVLEDELGRITPIDPRPRATGPVGD